MSGQIFQTMDDYRLENAARMNIPESVDGCQQVSWRNILQKIICDGIFRINADEIQQELLDRKSVV